MDDSMLMKISLITAILGLFILFFVSENLSFDSDIISAEIGDKISLKGKVVDVEDMENMQIIGIVPYGKTQVIIFDKTSIQAGDSVEVIGKVQDYKGKKEVIADEIREI